MGIARGGVGLFEGLEHFLRLFALADVTAQDGIEEAGARAEAQAFGQFHGLMHGGVIGDAFQPEKLVKSQMEQVSQRGALSTAAGLAGDQPVQGALPADHAIDQFLAQSPVQGRKRMAGQFALQQLFDVIAGGTALP